MVNFTIIIHFLSLTLLVFADNRNIQVTNKCSNVLTIGVLTNGVGGATPEQSFDLTPQASRMISQPDTWGGRVWGRLECSGSAGNDVQKCGVPGAANPATLAEFFFKGAYNKDFYDISLVDGYNVGMTISPQGVQGNGYNCGSPSCAVPSCPSDLAITDSTGATIACQSSCSKTGSAEHCCTGSQDNPNVCQADSRSQQVKSACPDAYSFAYDDQSSTFECAQASGYSVQFC